MANYIQRPRLFDPALAYQQGQLARNQFEAGQITNALNLFNLEQAQQMAPVRQQQEIAELKTQLQSYNSAQRKAFFENVNRIQRGNDAFEAQPDWIKQQEYDRYYAMNTQLGDGNNDMPTPEEFRRDPTSLQRWRRGFDYQVGELQRDLKLTEVGTPGGLKQRAWVDPARPEYIQPVGSPMSSSPLVNVVNYPEGKMPLDKKNITATQKQIQRAEKDLDDLYNLRKQYSETYLTIPGRGRLLFDQALDHLGLLDNKEFLAKSTKFHNSTERFFNRYRKEITGAAAAIQELKQLRKNFINGDMSPTVYIASLESLIEGGRRELEAYKEQIREGVSIQPEQEVREQEVNWSDM